MVLRCAVMLFIALLAAERKLVTRPLSIQVAGAGESGSEHRSDAAVLLVLEQVVAVGSLVEGEGMGEQVPCGQLTGGDALQEHGDVALAVHLGRADGQSFVDDGADGHLVDQSGEDAEDEQGAAFAAGVDRLPEGVWPVGLQPQELLGLS